MAKEIQIKLADLVGHPSAVSKISPQRYSQLGTSLSTVEEILIELKKPGRDPRQSFEEFAFRDDVQTLEDLHSGMVLNGIVTNVTNFGAFVDVGVHQDGLVHLSKLSRRRINTPHDVVRLGQRVEVRVLEVDLKKRRISLATDL